jgi:hypothetical protein
MFDVAMALERSDVVLTIARDCLWLGALGAWPAVLQQAIVKEMLLLFTLLNPNSKMRSETLVLEFCYSLNN